jgi:hypothetical protein
MLIRPTPEPPSVAPYKTHGPIVATTGFTMFDSITYTIEAGMVFGAVVD